MIPKIEKQFNESILEKVASAFGVICEQCKSLGGFESYVYEYTKNHKAYILKITHTLRRHKNYIMVDGFVPVNFKQVVFRHKKPLKFIYSLSLF